MHEVSLAAGVLQLVEDAAGREHFSRVAALRLEVGQLAGVEVEALRFALEAIAPGKRAIPAFGPKRQRPAGRR